MKKEIFIGMILIIISIFGIIFLGQNKKLSGVAIEVPQFYEDKTTNLCYLVHVDKTKDLMKPGDYPPNLKHNGDWAYCTYAVKQTILKDGEYYKTYNFSTSTKEVFAKKTNQSPATTTLENLSL